MLLITVFQRLLQTINGKEKFFLYFCNGANRIVVLESDSPTSPWSDPLGKPLIARQTYNCQDVVWCFDPAVFVDDDGTGYLYFGGGIADGGDYAHPKTARVVKLGDDMVSLANTPQEIDAPYLFQDSCMTKINGKYYYSYCSNFNTTGNSYGLNGGTIQYMVSDNPMESFTYTGQMFNSIYSFFGTEGGVNVRAIDNSGNTVITDVQRGDWISVNDLNFSQGSKSVTVRASSTKDAVIKICIGSADGEAIGYVKVSNTNGQLKDFTTSVSNITGVQDVYFVFSDTLEFDNWSFTK